MELFRQWGLDERVRAAEFELEYVSALVSLTLAQPELARLPLGFPPVEENERRWQVELWHGVAPKQGERLQDYDRERCLTLVRTAGGVPALDVEVMEVQAFTFAAQVAQRYRQGNVFLAGDAAHRMTP